MKGSLMSFFNSSSRHFLRHHKIALARSTEQITTTKSAKIAATTKIHEKKVSSVLTVLASWEYIASLIVYLIFMGELTPFSLAASIMNRYWPGFKSGSTKKGRLLLWIDERGFSMSSSNFRTMREKLCSDPPFQPASHETARKLSSLPFFGVTKTLQWLTTSGMPAK